MSFRKSKRITDFITEVKEKTKVIKKKKRNRFLNR